VVTLNRGSGCQDVVITGQTYPAYQGAVIVCQGADNSAVRLAVSEAVSALTGLSSDKISILKWQP
jgi:stage III sporulation protein AG